MRVIELAKDLGVSSEVLVNLLRMLRISVSSDEAPMSEGDGYLKAIQQLPDDVCRHSGEGREVDSHLKCNT